MRYEVRSSWPPGRAEFWYLQRSDGAQLGIMTEAEANIISWALNAVAEDRVLDAPKQGLGGAFDTIRYNGPTEGVAP